MNSHTIDEDTDADADADIDIDIDTYIPIHTHTHIKQTRTRTLTDTHILQWATHTYSNMRTVCSSRVQCGEKNLREPMPAGVACAQADWMPALWTAASRRRRSIACRVCRQRVLVRQKKVLAAIRANRFQESTSFFSLCYPLHLPLSHSLSHPLSGFDSGVHKRDLTCSTPTGEGFATSGISFCVKYFLVRVGCR